MVADHQGGQYQGGMKRSLNAVLAFRRCGRAIAEAQPTCSQYGGFAAGVIRRIRMADALLN